MSKVQLNQSLKDVLPNFQGDYPPALVSFIDSLYQLSLQKLPTLPHKADVARYHLCTFLAVERYQQRFSLPAPELRKVPLQPKLVEKLLDDIEDKVMGSMSSPMSTPKKLNVSELSPSKRPHTPSVGSPLRKLQKLQEESETNPFAIKSPFNPDGKAVHELRNEASPFNITQKLLSASGPRSPLKTPRKSPLKNSNSGPSSPFSPRFHRTMAIPDFISFANNFYIPASVTPSLLETFMIEKYKFVKKNEWLLACGLIHAAYVRINDKLLKNSLGKKAEFQNQLFQYQKGGLMKNTMIEWINRIEESVKGQSWALDLELKYVHNDWSEEDTTKEQEIEAKLGNGWELSSWLGSMINPSYMFTKNSQSEYYSCWTKRVREKIKAHNLKASRESESNGPGKKDGVVKKISQETTK